MKRQPNTRQKIIAAGIYLALVDAESLEPGSAERLRHWQDLKNNQTQLRCIAVGRVVNGGPVQIETAACLKKIIAQFERLQ